MNCYLHKDLLPYFSREKSLFDQLMALQGDCFRDQNHRRTQRVIVGGKYYFIKQHCGTGWKEIFKNLLQGRLPVVSARNEWLAIQKLHSLDVSVPRVVAFGEHGFNPATRQSFIMMEELSPIVSLETLGQSWKVSPLSFTFKRSLIEQVARIARIMHQHGLNHRDFYLCHFLLDISPEALGTSRSQLTLIDLHRAQMRRLTPLRWIVKDLAGLYFSSKDCGLTKRDRFRFIRAYHHQSLHDIFNAEEKCWQQVKERGERLYRDHHQA